MSQPLIPLEKIEAFVQLEPALLITCLSLGAWFLYKFFLKDVSEERHINLQTRFKNLAFHILVGIITFLTYYTLHSKLGENEISPRLVAYLGLAAMISGCSILVKLCRIFVFEYLFLSHMKVAVPLLLVNLCTLLFSLLLAAWIGTEIFNLKVVPLLATSAVLSLVLGLALQDTLGNLFAGIALQLDKPYEIDDWIEIYNEGQRWTGRVHEISWRATHLVAFTEETITVANRVIAQSKISNFSTRVRPIIRSQAFRIPFDAPLDQARAALLSTAESVMGIRKHPAPLTLISETNESWILLKLVYFIDDYGAQYTIADQIINAALTSLEQARISLASSRISVLPMDPLTRPWPAIQSSSQIE